MAEDVDRGAHTELHFRKCAKGFTLGTGNGGVPSIYAFDDIRGVCAWLEREYTEPTTHYERFAAGTVDMAEIRRSVGQTP